MRVFFYIAAAVVLFGGLYWIGKRAMRGVAADAGVREPGVVPAPAIPQAMRPKGLPLVGQTRTAVPLPLAAGDSGDIVPSVKSVAGWPPSMRTIGGKVI